MSKYGWESGTIKLPSRAWAGFKKALREAHNKQRDDVLNMAVKVQKALAGEFKGKQGLNIHEVRRFMYQVADGSSEEKEMACDLVETSLKPASFWKTRKITQAMLTQYTGPKATVKTKAYYREGWSIVLDDDLRTVRWNVPVNNHAVEDAGESLMGSTLFDLLHKINYGKQRDMGGVIVGNDEYALDCGDGANYVVARYGRAGELHP